MTKKTNIQEAKKEDDNDLFEAEEVKAEDLSQQLDEKLDKVGKEDGDVDNDGDKDESDEYLANRRKVVSKAVAKESKDEMDGEEEEMDDDEEEMDEKKKCSSKIKAEEIKIDMSDDINALVEGETELSEAFKEKAQTLFESAVSSKIKEIEKSLQEDYEAKAEAFKSELQEQTTAEMETSVDFIVEQVNKYMDYVVSEWISQNEIAIENGLRTEIAEEFIGGLKNLFTEHYIDVPEEKTDLVQELAQKVETLKATVNESIETNMALKEENNKYKKAEIVESLSSDLSLSQKEKLVSLSEDIDFTSEEQFAKKVEILKSSYFTNKGKQSMNESFETLGENIDTSVDQESKPTTKMDIYAQAVSSFKANYSKTNI